MSLPTVDVCTYRGRTGWRLFRVTRTYEKGAPRTYDEKIVTLRKAKCFALHLAHAVVVARGSRLFQLQMLFCRVFVLASGVSPPVTAVFAFKKYLLWLSQPPENRCGSTFPWLFTRKHRPSLLRLACQRSWTLVALDRTQRDIWVTALRFFTGDQTDDTATFDAADMFSSGSGDSSSTPATSVSVTCIMM